MSYYQLTPEQQLQQDEEFWALLDAELEAEAKVEADYVASLTEEDFYKEFVLPTQTAEQDEELSEPSIELI